MPDSQATHTYAELAPRLERIVARNVTASSELIEEACQVAWSQWLAHREGITPAATLGWLATTATREALRMTRRRGHDLSIDALEGPRGTVIELPTREAGPEQVAEMHDRLAEVRRLPVRQQRILWLQGLGFSYGEISAQTGDSRRTVERQLLRARRRLTDPGAP